MKKFKERIKAETKLVSFFKHLLVITMFFKIFWIYFFFESQFQIFLKSQKYIWIFFFDIFFTISSIELLWKSILNRKLILNYTTSSVSSKFLNYDFLITTQTLRDELQKMTKTAIRRKENLKDRKLKKKQAKNGDVFEEVSTLYMYARLLSDFNFFSSKFFFKYEIWSWRSTKILLLFSHVIHLLLYTISISIQKSGV